VGVPVLRLDGVWLGFARGRGRIGVLQDVSLEVASGQIAAVLGARGQGKSTLIRVASGTLPVERGGVFIDGHGMTGLSDVRLSNVLARMIGIATRAGPEVRLNVADYLEMSLTATREYSGRERRGRVQRTLADFGLTDVAGLMWDELSDWQRVLVEFAQAVIGHPRLLLIDDVLDGLAPGTKQGALELIEGFAQDLNCGVLMAVSDHATATRAGQVWQLADGKLRLMHQDPNIIDLHHRRELRAAEN
jgi:ABC-type cobalamin/Fe3+-siderophores transport system ATPase subunit